MESGCGNLSIVFHMVVAGYIWKTTEMCHRTFRSYLTIVSMGESVFKIGILASFKMRLLRMICQRNYKTPENMPKNGVHF